MHAHMHARARPHVRTHTNTHACVCVNVSKHTPKNIYTYCCFHTETNVNPLTHAQVCCGWISSQQQVAFLLLTLLAIWSHTCAAHPPSSPSWSTFSISDFCMSMNPATGVKYQWILTHALTHTHAHHLHDKSYVIVEITNNAPLQRCIGYW